MERIIHATTPCYQLEQDCYDYALRHQMLCQKVRQHRYNFILIGDSITHFWEPGPNSQGGQCWQTAFGNRADILNLGFGWDRTCNVLWRLQNGEFFDQRPKLAMLNIGTNNLTQTDHYWGDTPTETAQGIEAVLRLLWALSPATQVLLMAVFPRTGKPHDEAIPELNAILAQKFSRHPQLIFLDITGDLTRNSQAFLPDGCHLTEKGYQIWLDRIRPWLP